MVGSFVIFPVIVGGRQASFPAAVVMVAVAIVTPCAIAAALGTLMEIATVAFTERGNVSVAAQEILTRLRADCEAL